MFGDRFSSSTSCSRWLHETEPGRLDQSLSCRFLKVATHPILGPADILAWAGTGKVHRGMRLSEPETAAVKRWDRVFGS